MCDGGGGGGGDGGGGGGGDFGGGDFGGGGGNGYHDDGNHHSSGNGGGSKMPWWVPLIFTSCFSVIALIVGVITLASSISKQNWAEVTGTVIGINTCANNGGSSNSGGTTYSATVEYEVDGQTYQYTGNSCSSFKPTVGNESTVLYDPEEPSVGANGNFAGLWLVPIIAIGLSIIICGVGICTVQKLRKTNNSANPSGQSMDTGNATSGGMGMASSQPASSTYPAATGTSTFASSPGGDTAAAPAPTSQPVQSSYGYNTSTSSSAPASTQNNNSSGKPSIFDQMSSGV